MNLLDPKTLTLAIVMKYMEDVGNQALCVEGQCPRSNVGNVSSLNKLQHYEIHSMLIFHSISRALGRPKVAQSEHAQTESCFASCWGSSAC